MAAPHKCLQIQVATTFNYYIKVRPWLPWEHCNPLKAPLTDHFTVVCSLTLCLNGSEVGGGLALIQTSTFVGNEPSYQKNNLIYRTKAVRSNQNKITFSLAAIQGAVSFRFKHPIFLCMKNKLLFILRMYE